MRCVVLGASGYLGGRLVPELLAVGHRVRVVARTPEKLAGVPWWDQVEVARGDVADRESIDRALAGQDVVYYLVHSLHRRDFVTVDRAAAYTVADAARETAAGRILLGSGVPTVALQAGVIIGSGSAPPGSTAARTCSSSPSTWALCWTPNWSAPGCSPSP